MSLGSDSAVFGEAHGEFTNFWKTVQRLFRSSNTISAQSSLNERTDLSFGGGYRTILNENMLLGVNSFFDTTKLGSRWYSSGSLGFEYAAILPGNDALDLSFNWYGNLFNRNVLANAFRRGPQNFDFEAGYSQELWNGGPDLRLNATGYRFSSGSGVYGMRGGAELKSRDGRFSVKYEAADDRINGTYHTVGAFVNVGFQLSKALDGESPLVMPEPIFRSPRNIRRRLTSGVQRTHPSQVHPIFIAAGNQWTTIATFVVPVTGWSMGAFGCSNDGISVTSFDWSSFTQMRFQSSSPPTNTKTAAGSNLLWFLLRDGNGLRSTTAIDLVPWSPAGIVDVIQVTSSTTGIGPAEFVAYVSNNNPRCISFSAGTVLTVSVR